MKRLFVIGLMLLTLTVQAQFQMFPTASSGSGIATSGGIGTNLQDYTSLRVTTGTNTALWTNNSLTFTNNGQLVLTGTNAAITTTNGGKLVIQKETGANSSGLDLILDNPGSGKLLRMFAGTPSPYDGVVTYFNDGGHFYSRLSMTLSGAYQGDVMDKDGSFAIKEALNGIPYYDPSSLGIWSDHIGPVVVIRSSFYSTNETHILGIKHNGLLTYYIREDGQIGWGAGTSTNFGSNFDTFLYRTNWGTLQTDGSLIIKSNLTLLSGSSTLYVAGDSNIRTNVAQFDVSVTDFVIGTRYTNVTRRAFIAASFQLTAAVAGTAAVTLNVEQAGVTNKLTVSSGPLAGLTTIEPLTLLVGPGAFYTFTDATSGAGASVAIVAGTSSKTSL